LKDLKENNSILNDRGVEKSIKVTWNQRNEKCSIILSEARGECSDSFYEID
jgi:hypothetical protein